LKQNIDDHKCINSYIESNNAAFTKENAKLKSKVDSMELKFEKLNAFFAAKSVAYDR
jgi:hypothetical protein